MTIRPCPLRPPDGLRDRPSDSSIRPSSRPSAARSRRPACSRRASSTTRRSSTTSRRTGSAGTGSASGGTRRRPTAASTSSPASRGENVIVVRGADGELRAFHNVCRHRGSTILEESCGKLVRIQCPYHAWTYDLEGRLQRAKHTEDLVDFEPAENSLVPGPLRALAGLRLPEPRPGGAARSSTPSRTCPATSSGSTSARSAAPGGSPTTSTPTGRRSPRTTPSATTARASTPSSTG